MNLGSQISSMQVRQKLILLAGIAFVTLWALAAWMGYVNYQNGLAQMDQKTGTLATALSRQTELTFQMADHVLQEIRHDVLATKAGQWQIGPDHIADMADLLASASIVDTNGRVVYSTRKNSLNTDYGSNSKAFRQYKEGGEDRLLVSAALKDSDSGDWHIDITRPLLDDGRFAGVLVMSMNPRIFSRHFQSEALGSQGLVSMVSDNGALLARSLESDRFSGEVIHSAPFLQVNAPLTGHFRNVSPLDGVSRNYSYVRLPAYQLTLLAAVGRDEHLAPLSQQRTYLMVIALSVNILMFMAVRGLLHNMVRREEIEQNLRESQARYQGLVESLPVGVVVHRHGRVLYLNPKAVEIIGARSIEDMVGHPILETVHPDYRAAAAARIKSSRRRRNPHAAV